MRVEIFDRADLALNGPAARPLLDEVTHLNDCGRFVFRDVVPPASGAVIIRLSNAATSTTWTATLRVADVAPNARLDDVDVYAVRARVEAGWSVQASALLSGQSLASVGAAVELYLHKGDGIAGVDTGAQLYFADEASGGPVVLDLGSSVTGTTGGALRLTEATAPATGGEPALEGCSWPLPRSMIAPEHISVTTVDSVDGLGQQCE